jgi:hypothetical protein
MLPEGSVAPDFVALDQDGDEFRLSDHRGKIRRAYDVKDVNAFAGEALADLRALRS